MGSTSWGLSPHHAAVRDALAAFVRAHGKKRGLHLAAARIGMTERAARHAYEGGPFAADAARAMRADAARLDLIREQIARLRAEEREIIDVDMAGPALDARGRVLRGARNGVLPTRAAVTP